MALTTVQLITQLYVGYYNRAPDPEGLNYWVGRVNAGVSLADIADSFAASPEAIATYPYLALPNVANAENFLTQVYLNLFGRTPDADGLAYYSDKLATGATTPGQIIAEIQANANTNTTPGNTDGAFLANKVAVGEYWVNEAINTPNFQFNDSAKSSASSVLVGVTENAATVNAAKAAADSFFNEPNTPAVAFTTGIDALVGTAGNDLFTATQATLQAADTLDGGAGRDVLNYVATGSAHALAGASIKNVEVINIRNITGGEPIPATKEVATFSFADVVVKAAANLEPAETVTIEIAGRQVVLTGNVFGAGDATFTAANIASAFAGTASAGITVGGALSGDYTVATGAGNTAVFTAVNTGPQGNLSAAVTIVPAVGSNTAVVATPGVSVVDGADASAAAGGLVSAAAGNFVGATEFNSVNSTQAVEFSDVSATQAVGLSGGTAAGTLAYTLAAGATSTTINLTSTGAGRTVTVNSANVAEVTVNSKGTSNAGTLNLSTNTSVNKLTVNAAADLTATLNAAHFATAGADLLVSGAASKVDLGAVGGRFKTVDSTGLTTGALTAGITAETTSVKTGAGADVITVNGLAATGNINLGAGNDKLLAGGGAISKDAVVDGGEGKDTLAAALVNVVNAGVFSNFEYLELSALNATLDVDLLAGKNTVEKLIINGNTGVNAAVSNVAAGVGLEVTGSSNQDIVIGQKGVTTGGTAVDQFTVTFNAAAAPGGAAKVVTLAGVQLDKIDEITIVSDGGAKVSNVLTSIVSDEAKSIIITGDNALTLGRLDTVANTASNVLKTIDASAHTGGLNVDLAAVNGVLTVKLGGGDDVVSATLGSVGPNAPSTAAAFDKIEGFDKATTAELADGKGYDLIKLVDSDAALNFTAAANAAGGAANVKIADGVVDFSTLTNGPTDLASAITQINADVGVDGNAVLFTYGANSYVFVQNGGADLVVELTGVTGVTKFAEFGVTDSFYIV